MNLIFNKFPYDSIEETGPAKIYFGAVGVCLILFLISFFTILNAVNLERETLMKKIVDTEYTLKKSFKVVASKHEVHKNLSLKTGELNMKKKQLPSEEALTKLLIRLPGLVKKGMLTLCILKLPMEWWMIFIKRSLRILGSVVDCGRRWICLPPCKICCK